MKQSDIEDDICKIIVLGDSGVGKTHLLYSYTKGKLPNNIGPTISLEYSPIVINLQDNRKARVQLWDTAGQEQFRSLPDLLFRSVDGAIVVYDVTNQGSFKHVGQWINTIRQKAPPGTPICLFAHKIDSIKRQVGEVEGKKTASNEKVLYFETTMYRSDTIGNGLKNLIYDVVQNKRSKREGSIKLTHQEQEGGCKC